MKSIHKLINQKGKQLTLILIGLQFIIILGGLIPVKEKLPYYQQKIEALDLKIKELEHQAIHQAYYQERESETSTKLAQYKSEVDKKNSKISLQKHLISLQKRHHLNLVSQHIETKIQRERLYFITIYQTVDGTYKSIVSYLKSLRNSSDYLAITKCDIINTAPQSKNPLLTMNLSIKLIFPVDT